MKPVVAVLRGGPSHHYETSLNTGAFVLKHLGDEYSPRDILIDKEGNWYVGGLQVLPQRALEHTDVVWNALHGGYGEDGKIQQILNSLGATYVGSDTIASAISQNRKLAKERYLANNIQTPSHIIISETDDINERADYIFLHFYMPVVIKPADGGMATVGVLVATQRHEIVPLVEHARTLSKEVIVETYIPGKEITCIVVEDMRDQDYYVPIPLELKDNEYEEIINFNEAVKQRISQAAIAAHQALGLRHFSSSDMKVTPSGKVYVLETSTSPILHDNSATVRSLQSVGISPELFIEHMVGLARNEE